MTLFSVRKIKTNHTHIDTDTLTHMVKQDRQDEFKDMHNKEHIVNTME